MSAPRNAESEIEREARRILPLLAMPGAHLRAGGENGWCVARSDGTGRDTALGAGLVEAFARRGWLARAGAAGCFVLSDAGQGWYRRALAAEDPFAAQHQLRRTRLVSDGRGSERRVTVDDAESPLARLKARGLIDAAQFDAGEKLRADFTLARLMPRLGVDLSQPLVLGRRGQKPEQNFSDIVVAARQRFAKAMRAAGPGLGDLLFDVCCHLRGLEEAERANGWPGRSGRVVLAIALDALAEHYGMRMRGGGKMRSWRLEEGEAGG